MLKTLADDRETLETVAAEGQLAGVIEGRAREFVQEITYDVLEGLVAKVRDGSITPTDTFTGLGRIAGVWDLQDRLLTKRDRGAAAKERIVKDGS